MAKIIDVTLATMRNVGPLNVSPKGVIRCSTVRAVNDEEAHQVEALYYTLDYNLRYRCIQVEQQGFYQSESVIQRHKTTYSPSR